MENQDRIIKFLAYEGKVSIICANTTYLVEKARKIHDLSPVATAALGRTLTIASIMGVNMKQVKDKLTIQIRGNGPIQTMVVVANNFPRVKGYVQNPFVDLPLTKEGKLDVGTAVGKEGYLNVIKDLGMKEPYVGMVPLVSGEIAEDFTNYFASSEQTPCVVALGVLVNKEGVQAAGGYVLTTMPDATEEEISIIEENVKKIESSSKMLDQKLSLKEIAKQVTKDENVEIIEENIIPIYECDCSKEKIEGGLLTLGEKELEDMAQTQDKIETVCQFCNAKYEFTSKELRELIEISKREK